MRTIASALITAAAALGATPTPPPLAAQAPGHLIDVENGQLYWEECGSAATTLVLVHDGVGHTAVWDGVWPELCQQFRVIRYDRRGYGRSPVTKGWHSETADLLAVFNAAHIGRAVVVGGSHGGELSIDFTLENPERVQQLVLVGAVLSGFPYTDHFIRRGSAMLAPLRTGDVAKAIELVSRDPYVLAPGHPENQNRLAALLTASPQDLTHASMIRPTKPAIHRLGEIGIPALILVGDADIPDVHAHAGAIELGIPRSRRIVVSDAGHLLYLERPKEFVRLVTEFVTAHQP